MNHSTTLTPGQKLLKQAREELDDALFFNPNESMKYPELIGSYAQTIAILELIKTLKKTS